jgi:sugar/nucleoside kinase (ribokinase family)
MGIRDHDKVIVAGHICLDIIPEIWNPIGTSHSIFTPGSLTSVGPAHITTGGAVANTGMAMHRLGMNVSLMGKVGTDMFGSAIVNILRQNGSQLADDMIVAEDVHTSYSIVINPPEADRMFLHSTGANDTFRSSDLQEDRLSQGKLFHFGYPPLMRDMYENDGVELINMFRKVKSCELMTSLDMALPDPESAAGKADWSKILRGLLPYTDIFLPSIDELLFMLRRLDYDQWVANERTSFLATQGADLLTSLSDELVEMGCAIIVIKLGEYGLYMRTTGNISRLRSCGIFTEKQLEAWCMRELYIPCYDVSVAGTTGAGDCTIAGFLSGLLRQLSPEQTMKSAVGVGACNVQQLDAISGIVGWEEVCRYIEEWRLAEVTIPLQDWNLLDGEQLYIGPRNK